MESLLTQFLARKYPKNSLYTEIGLERGSLSLSLSIYIYIYVYTERESLCRDNLNSASSQESVERVCIEMFYTEEFLYNI